MNALEKRKKIYFVVVDLIIIFIIGVMHFIFYFFIKESDFSNIFDVFDSSPLFNFNIGSNCGSFDYVVFHVWQGRKTHYDSKSAHNSKTEIMDIIDIDKINGNYFCFKKILYKDLLYNGQIIKKGELCPKEYNNNCGTIDTLEQQLCIKNTETCPLYDVGIGNPPDLINYIHKNDNNENIYYNNNNYNEKNKKIIGKLILNEGKPCYQLDEKLWRKFASDEEGKKHLECELEVFGKLNDDRYNNRGDITYQKIYKDNLGSAIYNFLFKELDEKLKNKKVTLYKREFLGIDKACDEKAHINKDNYEKLRKYQKKEGLCILIESILIFSFLILLIIYIYTIKYQKCLYKNDEIVLLVFIIICLLSYVVCIICQPVFLLKIIKYDFSYNCSDDITNEVLRLNTLNTKKSISYSRINLIADVIYILFNVFALLFFINKVKEADNIVQNQIEIDNLNKEPIRDVRIQNENPNINEKPSDRINNYNDINDKNININDREINPSSDLGVPPTIAPDFNSEDKLI